MDRILAQGARALSRPDELRLELQTVRPDKLKLELQTGNLKKE
jgi:hypothetical protein